MPSLIKSSNSENMAASANGKLTHELFEAAGIAVTTTSREAPRIATAPDGLVRHQPSKAEILRLGREAMLQLHRGNDWTHWQRVLPVLDIARSAAMLEANTNKPQGRRYCDALGKWFRCHAEFEALGKLDKGTRAHFFECFANLEAINLWRASLPAEQQLKLNYPSTVLAHWKKHCAAPATRAGTSKGKKSSAPPNPKLADVWAAASREDKARVLNRESRAGLVEIASPALLAEVRDHAIGLQINSAPSTKNSDLRVALTHIIRQAIGAMTPGEAAAACDAFRRKCASNNVDPCDVLITFPKRTAKKR